MAAWSLISSPSWTLLLLLFMPLVTSWTVKALPFFPLHLASIKFFFFFLVKVIGKWSWVVLWVRLMVHVSPKFSACFEFLLVSFCDLQHLLSLRSREAWSGLLFFPFPFFLFLFFVVYFFVCDRCFCRWSKAKIAESRIWADIWERGLEIGSWKEVFLYKESLYYCSFCDW